MAAGAAPARLDEKPTPPYVIVGERGRDGLLRLATVCNGLNWADGTEYAARDMSVADRPSAVGRLCPLWRISFSSTFIYLGALQSTVT
jgi:hypothetical protein